MCFSTCRGERQQTTHRHFLPVGSSCERTCHADEVTLKSNKMRIGPCHSVTSLAGLVVLVVATLRVDSSWALQQRPPTPQTRQAPPAWWKTTWDALLPPPGEPGTPIGTGDFLFGLRSNVETQLFGVVPTKNNDQSNSFYQVPQADTDPSSMQTSFFDTIARLRSSTGPVFCLDLGATRITYIGDQAATKQVLLDSGTYDKGLVGLVGWDVFGQGLITALDRDVWKRRRRAVAPTLGANKNWLDGLVDDFAACTRGCFATLDNAANSGTAMETTTTTTVDLEETCLAIALDALGITVFGTEFQAATAIRKEGGDPLVKAVYRVLKETNIRAEKPVNIVASFLRPMWLAELLSPELKEFRQASRLLDNKINELIADLKKGVETGEDEETSTPSILRILVEARDGETTSQQLKDDLVTLLIAGHETVGSVLTWTLFELARNPGELRKLQEEIDAVLGNDNDNDSTISMSHVMKLECTRRALTESLRLYPAPPLLSRRALRDVTLPLSDGVNPPFQLKRGDNIFLLTAMLHRDPRLFGEDAEEFRPDRWAGPICGDVQAAPTWKGFEGPQSDPRSLYPSEKATDFALIGFGAGEFKCVGDKFAFVEATVALALLLQRYEFDLVTEDVGFDMAGTIHTSNGLMARVRRRPPTTDTASVTSVKQAASR